MDVVTPCFSEWACNVVLASKKDDTFRLFIDFRVLILTTGKDMYPLVRINDCLDVLHGSKYFTSLDLASGN